MPSKGRGRSGSGPFESKPPALRLRRILQERRSSAKRSSSGSISGSKRKASEGADSQSVPRSVSSSSSSSIPTEAGSDSYGSCLDEALGLDYDTDGQSVCFEVDNEWKKFVFSDADGAYVNTPHDGLMLLLFEAPSGFALFTFSGAYWSRPEVVDTIWAHFGDRIHSSMVVYPKGFLSFDDKSTVITESGVDKRLVDLINKWYHPMMYLCVGRSEYKRAIEKVLKIPCMLGKFVGEIMWGIQQQMHDLVPKEKAKLIEKDRLPLSKGLIKFLCAQKLNFEPEMVDKKIVMTACTLFHCDDENEENLGLLRDAGLNIRDISGIACEDWDILKLAIAVKVIRCPQEELSDFHEVLTQGLVSKLKSDARKYKGNPVKQYWFRASDEVVSNHHLRIAKKKLLGSLVKKAKKAYEAKQAKVEKKYLHNQNYLYPTNLVGEVLRRSPRLNPNMNEDIGRYGTPDKRPKRSCTRGTPMAIGS